MLPREDAERRQNHRAGEHLPVVGQIVAAIAQDDPAPQSGKQPGELVELLLELAGGRGQLRPKCLTLVVQQQRVLQPGPGKSAIVQPDDEGHRATGMAAGQDVSHMQAARPRSAPATRTWSTSPASHSRKSWLSSPPTCSNQPCIPWISSVRACKA